MGGALAAFAIGHCRSEHVLLDDIRRIRFYHHPVRRGIGGPAFVGSLAFESLRSFAFAMLPQLWQMLLGSVLLLTILFLPQGLGSLVTRLRWRRKAAVP